ncbi:MAG: hypothetical protein P4L79_09535 [Legionella sp.]|uniref:hypothetical protein n=1 Tax=Legionella sp. TaxID=459 RepID=UPI00283CBA15|nr:hypothetical protein [Legionella sp.]
MMIIQNEQEKIVFLRECQDQINRIFNSYLTESEKRDITRNERGLNGPLLTISDNKIAGDLPESIKSSGWLHNYKMGKLLVLTSIYNEVSKAPLGSNGIDLKEIYKNVKKSADSDLSDRFLPNSDELMKSHRSHFLRSGIIGTLLSFIWAPKSTSFLKRSGFFATEDNPRPNSNEESNSNTLK